LHGRGIRVFVFDAAAEPAMEVWHVVSKTCFRRRFVPGRLGRLSFLVLLLVLLLVGPLIGLFDSFKCWLVCGSMTLVEVSGIDDIQFIICPVSWTCEGD